MDRFFHRNTDHMMKMILSPTLIIAGITLASYILSFNYYRGYFSYFNLPMELIEFNVINFFSYSQVPISILILTTVVFIVIAFSLRIYDISEMKTRNVMIIIFQIIILIISILTDVIRDNSLTIEKRFLWFSPASGLLILFMTIFLTLIFKKESKKIIEKSISSEKIQEKIETKKRTFTYYLFYATIISTILFSFQILAITKTAGWLTAENQTQYYVIQSEPNELVLYMSNDKIISARYGKLSRIVDSKISIHVINNMDQIDIKLVDTGQLIMGDLFSIKD